MEGYLGFPCLEYCEHCPTEFCGVHVFSTGVYSLNICTPKCEIEGCCGDSISLSKELPYRPPGGC